MTVTPQTIDLMNVFADEIGAHFAKEPDERVMLVWLDTIIRNEIVDDCCSPVTRMRDLIAECTAIDRMLDRVERKRKEIITSMPRQEILQLAAEAVAQEWSAAERRKAEDWRDDELWITATNVLARFYRYNLDQEERHKVIEELAPIELVRIRREHRILDEVLA